MMWQAAPNTVKFILPALSVLSALAFLVVPLFAYDVALKDGRVLHFQKYSVVNNKLYVTGNDNTEQSVPLDMIDLDRTKQLNVGHDDPPLDLPSLSIKNQSPPQQESLGEAARRLRGNNPVTPKRTFTDDDVQTATSDQIISGVLSRDSSAGPSNPGRFREAAIALAKTMQHLTEKEVASEVLLKLDAIEFPGRERWQTQLYAAHQKVATLLEICVDRHDEENHAACFKLTAAQADLRSLKDEGKRRAEWWKADREEKQSK